MITWQCKFFPDLSLFELYKILQLRSAVFIVEQNCAYQDLDDKDLKAYHYSGWEDEKIIAYTRLLAKGIFYEDAASIGRVVIAESVRGKNIGKQLMRNSIDQIHDLFGDVPIRISAQLYLKGFYESLSFIQKSGVYMEDGIEHISMLHVAS